MVIFPVTLTLVSVPTLVMLGCAAVVTVPAVVALEAETSVSWLPFPIRYAPVTFALAVTAPVMLILPVPSMFLLLRSRLPPSCGEVSSTTLFIPPVAPLIVLQLLLNKPVHCRL